MSIQLTCTHCEQAERYDPEKILDEYFKVYSTPKFTPKDRDIPDPVMVRCKRCSKLFAISKQEYTSKITNANLGI